MQLLRKTWQPHLLISSSSPRIYKDLLTRVTGNRLLNSINSVIPVTPICWPCLSGSEPPTHQESNIHRHVPPISLRTLHWVRLPSVWGRHLYIKLNRWTVSSLVCYEKKQIQLHSMYLLVFVLFCFIDGIVNRRNSFRNQKSNNFQVIISVCTVKAP